MSTNRYGSGMAGFYNRRMAQPSLHLGHQLLNLAATASGAHGGGPLLELCCGTGQLALSLADSGYSVMAVDHSPEMIGQALNNLEIHARERHAGKTPSGTVEFVVQDLASLQLPTRYPLVLAVGNALNHMRDPSHLAASLYAIANSAEPGAAFAFDFNTRLGLQSWNHASFQDEPGTVLLIRGSYISGDSHARSQVTGFEIDDDGHWVRFDECITNLVMSCTELSAALQEAGWKPPEFHDSLGQRLALEQAERQPLLLVVTRKSSG